MTDEQAHEATNLRIHKPRHATRGLLKSLDSIGACFERGDCPLPVLYPDPKNTVHTACCVLPNSWSRRPDMAQNETIQTVHSPSKS